MERTYVKDLSSHVGESVSIKGFVQAIRNQGSISFLNVRDVTGIVQAVVLKSSPAFATVTELTLESVVEVIGLAKAEKQAPGGYEVDAQEIVILSKAYPELPIPVVEEKSGEGVDISKRLDWRHIDLRKPENQKIFKVWTSLEKGFREFCLENGFTQVYTPNFMSVPSESGSEVFEVKYFDRNAYLAQSPQFYKQAAQAAGFERVFMVGPVFRAEPSYTTRHMTEFTGFDYEFSYIESHHDVMDLHEKFILAGLQKVKEEVLPDLFVQEVPIPRITMQEAKEKLAKAGVKSEKPGDVSPEEERELCRLVQEETGSELVFLTDYSSEIRPFYHMRYAEDPKTTKSFDLLYRGLEITTGAQREHRYDVLIAQAKEKGMGLESLEHYLNFFKYGCPPHGGVGVGPGRIIMKLLDLASVKEATFFPRDVKRLTP